MFNAPPTTVELNVVAWLQYPPPTKLQAPDAVLNTPPTTEAFALAILLCPAPIKPLPPLADGIVLQYPPTIAA